MTTINKLEKAFDKALKAYEANKEEIATANERVNVAAQLFSMGEVEKDILVAAVELRDTIKQKKAALWDEVAKADLELNKMKRAQKREAKVEELKAKLNELSK